MRESGVEVWPESKADEPRVALQLAGELASLEYAPHATVQSFGSAPRVEMLSEHPDVRTCRLDGLGGFDVSAPRPTHIEAVCPMADMVLLDPCLIRRAHQDGHSVYAWFGASSIPDDTALIGLGVDGLIVDDPRALAQVLDGRR